MSAESTSPLDQFKIKKLIDLEFAGIDISFTNTSLYMFIATFSIIAFLLLATRKKVLNSK